MNNQMNLYEKRGIDEFRNKGWVWRALFDADELYHLLINNKDEIPDVIYSEFNTSMTKLLDIKYAMLELIGRDSK